jgi:hypothetical protein
VAQANKNKNKKTRSSFHLTPTITFIMNQLTQ